MKSIRDSSDRKPFSIVEVMKVIVSAIPLATVVNCCRIGCMSTCIKLCATGWELGAGAVVSCCERLCLIGSESLGSSSD